MKKCIRHARFRVVAAAVATTLATVCVRRAEAQAVWNAGIGNWNTAANWSTNLVPNSGTTNVFIDFNQTAVSSIVNLDINATVNNLTIDAGDRLNFNAGTSINVNGYTSVDGLLLVGSNGGGAAFINFTATNSQSIFGPGEVLFGATNYTVRNNTGNNTVGLGIFMHGENAVFSGNSPQGFWNTGTIAADVAGGTFVFNSGISNDGILRAQNGGTLILNGGGNAIGGTFTANVGSTLTFNTGYGLDHSSAIDGAGTVSISGGTVLMGGSYNVAGVTQINGCMTL